MFPEWSKSSSVNELPITMGIAPIDLPGSSVQVALIKGAMPLDPCHTGQANTDVRTDLLWAGTTSNLTQARPVSDFLKYVPPAGEHRHLKTGFEKSDFGKFVPTAREHRHLKKDFERSDF